MFKNGQSVVWRDKNGDIKCPGDDCPQECDDTCPIWCQTMAITFLQMGMKEEAIKELKKGLILAPDFKDSWVNLAAIYGGMNNHMEANKAYKTAYAIDNNYKNAIFGLIISCKNLGQFDEALKYCDEYAKKVSKAEAEELRMQVMEAKNSGTICRQESALDMAMKIVKQARETGILGANDHLPNIPEIMVEAKRTCSVIIRDMIKDEDGKDPVLWLAWGAYAGIGAVWHWQIDWDNLKNKGIPETLLKPRGSFAMDEYVIDSIGIGFETPEGEEFTKKIYGLSMWAFGEFMVEAKGQAAIQIAHETAQAMYIFGMVLEMERLGMR